MAFLRHGPVSLQVPQGWEDLTQVISGGPVVDGFRSSITVSREDAKGLAADKLAARALPLLKQQFPSLQVVKEGVAKYGRWSGFSREYMFSANGKKIVQIQFTFVPDRNAYTLTFTQLATRMAAERKQAEELFASFNLAGASLGVDTLDLSGGAF